jgi:hypothetical protein
MPAEVIKRIHALVRHRHAPGGLVFADQHGQDKNKTDNSDDKSHGDALQFEFINEIMSEHFGSLRASAMKVSSIFSFILAAFEKWGYPCT